MNNQLIQVNNVLSLTLDKPRLLYRHLTDVVELHYNPLHAFNEEFIELFNSITYMAGRRVACFLRGPWCSGEGHGSHLNPLTENKSI